MLAFLPFSELQVRHKAELIVLLPPNYFLQHLGFYQTSLSCSKGHDFSP